MDLLVVGIGSPLLGASFPPSDRTLDILSYNPINVNMFVKNSSNYYLQPISNDFFNDCCVQMILKFEKL